ncbi:sensor domain-containing diguanylate cyclase [Lysobacter sp. A6]|uniref:diguanylate cyclase n=1 Tax=Noviluteimonas lactosilytica TaxID=2888523 RepID=A0ABS8JKM1_9GAMM|nr:sensor domain-containing diguanylate cyclase [Lysobacter lactosilyticus]MCC8364139.1 sensor domain-containing diguanylate cyclase [Lysobacter lactosilyticus]
MAAAVPIGIRSAGPDWALRRDFARLLVVAVVLPALILCALLAWSQSAKQRTDAATQLRSAAEISARGFDEFLQVHGAATRVLAARRGAEAMEDRGAFADRASWTGDLRRLRDQYPSFATMRVLDAQGRVIAAEPADRTGVSPGPCFDLVARDDAPASSDVYRAAPNQPPLACVASPIRVNERFAGIVEGAMRVEAFAGARVAWLRTHGYEAVLVDRLGQVAYASSGLPFQAMDRLDATGGGKALGAVAPGAPEAGWQRVDGVLHDDADAYAIAMGLDSGWRLLVLMPKETLDAQLFRTIATMLGLLVAVAAGVLGIAWWQMRRLSMSVHKLLVQMQRFALEHASSPIEPKSMPQELAPLADAMNSLSDRMADAYRATSRSLEEQRRLRASLEQVVDAREREIAQRTAELRNVVAELDRLSRTDALTGCLNYRGFREAANQLWREARDNGTMLSALALDIDHFKAYNDRYGHPRGDNALKRFAGAVRSALYHRDDVIVRPGGEEFIVFLPDTTLEQAVRVGERICASVLHADIAHAGSPVGVLTVSIGVATNLPEDGDDPEVMLARADAALYRAKHQGRNRVSL